MWLVDGGYVGKQDDWCWITDKGKPKQTASNVVPFRRPDEQPATDWDTFDEPNNYGPADEPA
jgi:hypothetical protein